MTLPSRYDGFASLDALVGLLPLALMALLLADAASTLMRNAEYSAYRQQAFDKAVSVADYTVKAGAARHGSGVRYPNWVEPGSLSAEYTASMRVRSGLSGLYIGLDEPADGFTVCIYRLVVTGEEKQIRRLYVCGR